MSLVPDNEFPPQVETQRLGSLKLEQHQVFPDMITRHYRPHKRIVIPSRLVRLDPRGIDIVVWLSDEGIRDVAEFVSIVEQRFDRIVANIDSILEEAVPVIDAAIAYFWQIPDEEAPTTAQLLATGWLDGLRLNAGPGTHEVHLFDAADLIGSHDLLIELDEKFRPVSAWFDG